MFLEQLLSSFKIKELLYNVKIKLINNIKKICKKLNYNFNKINTLTKSIKHHTAHSPKNV